MEAGYAEAELSEASTHFEVAKFPRMMMQHLMVEPDQSRAAYPRNKAA